MGGTCARRYCTPLVLLPRVVCFTFSLDALPPPCVLLSFLFGSKHSASGRTMGQTWDSMGHRDKSARTRRMGQDTHTKNEGPKAQSGSAWYLLGVTLPSLGMQATLQDATLLWERDRDISVFTKYVFRSPFPFTLMIPRHVHVYPSVCRMRLVSSVTYRRAWLAP